MENTKSNKAVWLMVFIVIFAVLYLVEVNSISTKGYEIKNLEKRMTSLQESNKRLELEAASLKSIQTIESDVKVLNFVPSGSVNYIPTQGYAFSAGEAK